MINGHIARMHLFAVSRAKYSIEFTRNTMVRHCCVAWCEIKEGQNKRGFFSFPKETNRRDIWIEFVSNGSGWIPNKSSVICTDHFSDEMLIRGKSRVKPKKNAYPGGRG